MSPFLAKVALACFAAQGPLAGGQPAPASPENPPRGVVIDFRGPPEGGKYSWEEVFYLEGRKEPKRIKVSGGGYASHALHGRKWAYEIEGFTVRKVGETQLEIIGLKTKDGKLLRVKKMEFQKPSLPPELLPKVHNPKPVVW